MSLGAELGQYILQTLQKILKIQWGEFEPPNLPGYASDYTNDLRLNTICAQKNANPIGSALTRVVNAAVCMIFLCTWKTRFPRPL